MSRMPRSTPRLRRGALLIRDPVPSWWARLCGAARSGAAPRPGHGPSSTSPADAWNPAEQPVILPDRRSGHRAATRSGFHKSCAFHPDRALHRECARSHRRGCAWHRNGTYGRRRDRRHSCRVADAAGIVDRAVASARIRRPRRNAADAGILGRRCCGSGQNAKHRNARQCRSADRPSQGGDR